MNGPTKTVGPPLTLFPARQRLVCLDNGDELPVERLFGRSNSSEQFCQGHTRFGLVQTTDNLFHGESLVLLCFTANIPLSD